MTKSVRYPMFRIVFQDNSVGVYFFKSMDSLVEYLKIQGDEVKYATKF